MTKIVVFGAGGRAGRRVVAEAAARGHEVTAVVRDPARYPELAGERVTVVAGDVTSAASVAARAAGHDAAVNATARLDIVPVDFYTAAARALLDGLARAGVGRLVAIAIGLLLEISPGVPGHDAPGVPEQARAFTLGHAAGLDLLRAADPALDWVALAPPPTYLDDEARGTGKYVIGGQTVLPSGDEAPLFGYADLALAVVDEAENPKHHRALVAVGPQP